MKKLTDIIKEIEMEAPSKSISNDILQYSASKIDEKEIFLKNKFFGILMQKIIPLIPFFELGWLLNEVIIKKNKVKISFR